VTHAALRVSKASTGNSAVSTIPVSQQAQSVTSTALLSSITTPAASLVERSRSFSLFLRKPTTSQETTIVQSPFAETSERSISAPIAFAPTAGRHVIATASFATPPSPSKPITLALHVSSRIDIASSLLASVPDILDPRVSGIPLSAGFSAESGPSTTSIPPVALGPSSAWRREVSSAFYPSDPGALEPPTTSKFPVTSLLPLTSVSKVASRLPIASSSAAASVVSNGVTSASIASGSVVSDAVFFDSVAFNSITIQGVEVNSVVSASVTSEQPALMSTNPTRPTIIGVERLLAIVDSSLISGVCLISQTSELKLLPTTSGLLVDTPPTSAFTLGPSISGGLLLGTLTALLHSTFTCLPPLQLRKTTLSSVTIESVSLL
jgi:hypothetical protein